MRGEKQGKKDSRREGEREQSDGARQAQGLRGQVVGVTKLVRSYHKILF